MGSPVVRVPDENHLLAALPASIRKGPVPIGLQSGDSRSRRSRPFEILAPKGMLRQDGGEEGAPARHALAEDDPDGLRADCSDRSNEAMQALGLEGDARRSPWREDEVPRCDGHSVAPVGVGVDLEGHGEGRILVNVAPAQAAAAV